MSLIVPHRRTTQASWLTRGTFWQRFLKEVLIVGPLAFVFVFYASRRYGFDIDLPFQIFLTVAIAAGLSTLNARKPASREAQANKATQVASSAEIQN